RTHAHWATTQAPDSSRVRGHRRESACAWHAPALCDRHHHPRSTADHRTSAAPVRMESGYRCGSLLSVPEPNQRPLDYLHATRRLYGHALPFWWDGSDLVQMVDID